MKILSARPWLAAMLLWLITFSVACAQVPAWQSLTAIVPNTGGTTEVKATAVDASGDIIMTGIFTGTVSLGSTSLVSAGLADVFVAKWSPVTQRFVWAYQMGGNYSEDATAVVVRGTAIYLAGDFSSTVASFGALTLANSSTINTSERPSDVFVVKLIDAGGTASFVWAQRPTGEYREWSTGLTVSGSQVYLTGNMTGTVNPGGPGQTGSCYGCSNRMVFGPSAGAPIVSTIGPTQNGFVAKLVDAGNSADFVWAMLIGSASLTRTDNVSAIAVNGSSLYVAGSFSQYSLYFGTLYSSFTLYNVSSTSQNSSGFVAKLNDAGTTVSPVWAKVLGGPSEDVATAVVSSGADVYVAGKFSGTASFGSTSLTAVGTDVFVAKLLDNGPSATDVWAHQGRNVGSYAAVSSSLVVSNTRIYLAGYFGSASASFGGTTLTSGALGGRSLFVAALPTTGAGGFSWALTTGGTDNSAGNALVGSGASLYVAGVAGTASTFGSLGFAGQSGAAVGFLANVLDPTLTATHSALRPESIGLFPNPAHGRATIHLPAVPGATTATLTVLDALGRTLRTQMAATNSEAGLDLTGLAPGLYAVRVTAGGSTATQRLVVE